MSTLLEAFSLGLLGGIVPGSVLTILLVSVLRGGFGAGVRAFLWCLFAEVAVVTLLLTLMLSLPIPQSTYQYIGLVGGFVLMYFAWNIARITSMKAPEDTGDTFSGGKIFLLSATNAPLYIFWVTICTPLIWILAETLPLSLAVSGFMLAFELGWASSTFILVLLFFKARFFFLDPKRMTIVFKIVASGMLFFAIRMWYGSLLALNIL